MFFSILMSWHSPIIFFFFFNDTATTEIYTLSLHDALPISKDMKASAAWLGWLPDKKILFSEFVGGNSGIDRKSTRLNSSHLVISYAVFCLKKKKKSYSIYTTS